MAIKLKTAAEVAMLRAGGRILAEILNYLALQVKPGLTTAALDESARSLIAARGGEPSFLNYRPAGSRLAYPAALCVSLNEEIVHGLPGPRALVEGDIVTLDLGLKYQGLFTDMALTLPVGTVSAPAKRLIAATAEALTAGIKAIKPGGRVGDISAAIERVAKRERFGVVTDLAGHGVGYAVHEEPYVPNWGPAGGGESLRPGLVLAIEPMFTLGRGRTRLLADGFTFVTADGSLSAHWEKTVVVTTGGVEILTAP